MFVMMVTGERIGQGDDELGAILMRNFLYSLARSEQRPDKLMFMNGGVRLTCEGSESLADIRLLQEQGVAVRSCGTCLDFLGLKESLVVGEVGTMPDGVAAIAGADRVVTIA